MEVFLPSGAQVPWTCSLPQTNAGDFQMVTAWTTLGFIRNVGTSDNPNFVETERNDGSDNPPPTPGA